MGASGGRSSGVLRLGLLVTIAALFALIPVAQASAAESFTLTVNVEGEGLVFCEVENEEEGAFEEECGDQSPAYLEGSEVTLNVLEEVGFEFKEFSGDCVGAPAQCHLIMNEDHEVTVVFAPEPSEYKLTVNVVGSGEVKCEAEEGLETCKPTYPKEAEVEVVPVAGTFLGWSGDCSEDPCVLKMTGDRTVTATFKSEGSDGGSEGGGSPSVPQPPISLPSPVAVGPGKAKVAGAGLYKGGEATLRISCGGGGPCKGTVKLIAKLRVGHQTKEVTVGKASFSLPAGGSRSLKIMLSGPAKKLLGKGRTLTAKASGSGVTASKVKIKPTER
jgi:hypothetical protein